MVMKKYIFATTLVALIATACEKPVDFNGEERPPVLTLGMFMAPVAPAGNGYHMDDLEHDRHTIVFDESVFLFGKRPEYRNLFDNATFHVWHNGTEVPVQRDLYEDYDGTTEYSRPYFRAQLATGDKVEIEGSTPWHGTVTASDVVPAPADFRDLKAEFYQDNGVWYLRVRPTFADPRGEKNYYRIEIRSRTDYRHFFWSGGELQTVEDFYPESHGTGFTDREILFSNFGGDPIGGESTWGQFSDELIDGREYTLDLYIKLDRTIWMGDNMYIDPDDPWLNSGHKYEMTGQSVTVDIQTLSESAFMYLRSAELMGMGHNFSEPVQLYSNVKGGYGIFGTYNVASKTLTLPLLETPAEK
jgi:hypothetical protein